jgi:Glyoxalase-like domain
VTPSATGVPLWLDHASIAVPEARHAAFALDTDLGLQVTASPTEPHRHGRIHLDRSYLEVSSREPVDAWGMPLFFLRFTDPVALRHHLEATGLEHRFDTYRGVDGEWDDVEVVAGTVPLPILVRRTTPPALAKDWPPPLPAQHRCGARTLEAVHVTVPDLAAAAEAYGRLVGTEGTVTRGGDGEAVASVVLAAGRIVLVEGEPAGPSALVLGVDDLTATRRVVGPLNGAPVAWTDPARSRGLRIGFVARGPTGPPTGGSDRETPTDPPLTPQGAPRHLIDVRDAVRYRRAMCF